MQIARVCIIGVFLFSGFGVCAQTAGAWGKLFGRSSDQQSHKRDQRHSGDGIHSREVNQVRDQQLKNGQLQASNEQRKELIASPTPQVIQNGNGPVSQVNIFGDHRGQGPVVDQTSRPPVNWPETVGTITTKGFEALIEYQKMLRALNNSK